MEKELTKLFDKREAAIRKLQATADQLASELEAVVVLTDEIWKQMPARPLSTPPTFSRNLFARLGFYLYGATKGRIGSGHVNAYVASQQPDLIKAAQCDRELMETVIAKTEPEAA